MVSWIILSEANGNSSRVQFGTRGLESHHGVVLPCAGAGHTEDNAAIADGHDSQWQQKEAAEGEEVIGGLLPSGPETAFGGTLSERDWADLADNMKQNS